ncbi:MAG: methyltransferase domain-containing protein [Acidobacteria bacterium]|nr:methyltransferase domain-containing protein [Acidobacteriota bacterium]
MTHVPIEATIERCWREVATIEEAFEAGEIDREGWHRRIASLVVPAYLAGEDPRAQSGFEGTGADWEHARGLVAEAISRPGTFLDVGCANGLLMESVRAWCGQRGLSIEPFGVEISPQLAALARQRLPQWADRMFEGNAAGWSAPLRFDFVRTGLEYVPRSLAPALLEHLLSTAVHPRGRLLIGPYTEERDQTRSALSVQDTLRAWGFEPAGTLSRTHERDDRVVRRLTWIGGRARIPDLA